jgi:hypothetical protein
MHVADRVSTELCAESAFYINRKTTETAVLLLFSDKLFDSLTTWKYNPRFGCDSKDSMAPPTPARAVSGKGKVWKNMMELQDSDTDSKSDSANDISCDPLNLQLDLALKRMSNFELSRQTSHLMTIVKQKMAN